MIRVIRTNKVCKFCQNKKDSIDYKDVAFLRNYTSEKGKILPRRISGCCAKHQRMVAAAIKRSRYAAILAFHEE